nr:cas scaffolding protein family member 4 isoform X1 [Nothobranchius furzeri]
MKKLAKALYDNTAECPDELAFKKGDIIIVMDQNVDGTDGWWICSLHGQHGLAPANRLRLLPQTLDDPRLYIAESDNCVPNIYHTPSVPRSSRDLCVSNSPAYSMNMIYNSPSSTAVQSPSRLKAEDPEADKVSFVSTPFSPEERVYDVPSRRKTSLYTEATTPGLMSHRKKLISKLEKFKVQETSSCSSPGDASVYPVPPPQDANYDVPVPSATESPQTMIGAYSTLPNPRKPEWIYDVPLGSEKQSLHHSLYDTLPSKTNSSPLYDVLPSCNLSVQRANPNPSSLYDIPKANSFEIPSPPKALPSKEKPFCQMNADLSGNQMPLEDRSDPSKLSEFKKVRLQQMRNFLACTTFQDLSNNVEPLVQEDDKTRTCPSAPDSQRISRTSSSSGSSCDSLALSSPSPELLHEVTLSQDEACRKLLDLQESVCRAVPQLMEFVSSNWRCKQHLEKHLEEIKEATERIVGAVMCFQTFALGIKGNARHLTDINLQTRLYKQLLTVEDCAVILQQTTSALNMAGWTLHTLCQDPDEVQTPDQLDRFVMVARTVPDDIKRLVSIIYANSKLLFKSPQKDPESVEDDNDYIELMVKDEKQEKEEKEPKENISPTSETNDNMGPSDSSSTKEQHLPSLSEHCRLYFGALQKAIGAFVDSLHNGQPPEKFISQSKLVIMVGQRLVDTLCKEAHRQELSQSLLCKSNHLCALLKQLAVATKKAALHFPDKQALLEVKEFAKDLAQRAQHFRISLDL